MREDDLFVVTGTSTSLVFRVCSGGEVYRLIIGREAVTARDEDRVILRLFSSGGICSLSGSSAELFKDDSVSSAVSVLSGFSVAFSWRRDPLGGLANE